MSVQKIEVVLREAGGNGSPVSGQAWFSDGKVYGWRRSSDGIRFYTSRKRAHGGHERLAFSSPTRAVLLTAALNT